MQVLHHTRSSQSGPTHDRSGPDKIAKPIGHFGVHFMEMCAVMCLGGGLLIALFFGAAALLGFSDLRTGSPALSAFIVSCILGAAMVAWMRFRRMDWRPTLEMAGSSVAAGIVLIVGFWVGLVSEAALFPAVCGLACVAMVIVMLFRLDLYSSGHAAHAGHQG